MIRVLRPGVDPKAALQPRVDPEIVPVAPCYCAVHPDMSLVVAQINQPMSFTLGK